jgi:hypothetical protein
MAKKPRPGAVASQLASFPLGVFGPMSRSIVPSLFCTGLLRDPSERKRRASVGKSDAFSVS